MAKKLVQPLKWHGGKHYLAKWIISHFPPPNEYVHFGEMYFGGGSVLLQLADEIIKGHSVFVNDINGELMNFWGVLRCRPEFEQLKRFIEATPFCNDVFDSVCEINKNYEKALPGTPVDRAWRFFVLNRQSRQGLMKDFATMSRTRTRRGMNEQVSSWLTAIEGLPEIHERLKRVVIFNRNAIELIRQQDGPKTFFYLDPPYHHDTRVTKSDYTHEMSHGDHEDLLDCLSHIKGKFMLSGYRSKLYDEWEIDWDFCRSERQIDNKASSKKTKETKTECIWMNY